MAHTATEMTGGKNLHRELGLTFILYQCIVITKLASTLHIIRFFIRTLNILRLIVISFKSVF